MKKVTMFILCFCGSFFIYYQNVFAAGACDITVSPATDCEIGEYGIFSDPSMDKIIANKCPNNTTKENEYCTTYCRQDAKTIFPREIGPLAADQYDAILGGNHFRWDDITIDISKECVTEIDYDKWLADYNAAIETVIDTAMQYLGELHQQSTDKIKVPASKYPTNCRKAIGTETATADKNTEYLRRQQSGMNEQACKNIGGTWSGAGSGEHAHDSLCVWYEPYVTYSCETANSKVKGQNNDYKPNQNKGLCERTKYKYGNIHRYVKLEWNDAPPIRSLGERTYCDLGEKPYMDDATDQYFYGEYMKALQVAKNIKSKLSNCSNKANSELGSIKKSKPGVSVKWKDPMGVYSIGSNDIIQYIGTLVNTDEKVTVAEKAPSTVPKVTCNLPSPGSSTSLGQINSSCTITVENISGIAYTKYGKKVTKTYNYKMPSNKFNYILKETGESVDSNSPKVTETIKNNYRYIDIGYPNYPVHYTTPTGEYPIQLIYTNLGVNGYFTNKLPNKIGRYDCTYKVINRIKTCPQGECPDPDPEDPDGGGSNPPSGGGDGSPLGINIVYRPISLTDPFPGESGRGRTAGQNWTKDDINRYIKNNRGTSTNKVYNKTPLYSFTLDAKAIKAIRNYNKTVKEGYSDFNLTCSSKKNGKQCKSKFLKNITNYGVKVNANTCLNSTDFYGCAGKPNQDKIKCALNKDKKYVCANCATNPDSPLCKEGNK